MLRPLAWIIDSYVLSFTARVFLFVWASFCSFSAVIGLNGNLAVKACRDMAARHRDVHFIGVHFRFLSKGQANTPMTGAKGPDVKAHCFDVKIEILAVDAVTRIRP